MTAGESARTRTSGSTPGSKAHDRMMRAADVQITAERRQDRQTPLGPRAEKTRQRLIDSAWKLFRAHGYLATAVSDIADDAGVSLATFYQYFGERNDVVAVIVVDIVKEMLDSGVDRWDPRSGRAGLQSVIQPYVAGYARHADFFELWQCVTHVDNRMRALYREYHLSYQKRFGRFLAEGVELGLVRADLDPLGMATATTLMLERYCYEVFVLNPTDPPADVDVVVDIMTSLWADAIKLQERTPRPRRASVAGARNGVAAKRR